MDTAYELHRQQLINAYNKAVKRKDWQAARNYRDELNILVAKKVALSWPQKLLAKKLLFNYYESKSLLITHQKSMRVTSWHISNINDLRKKFF